MIVDTSALISMLREEPDAEALRTKLAEAPSASLSVGTFLEARIVAARTGNESDLRRLLDAAGATVVAFDERQAEIAYEGFRRYGEGRHPAGLNFGDLFAYALARASDEPLLFKGADFALTDVRTA